MVVDDQLEMEEVSLPGRSGRGLLFYEFSGSDRGWHSVRFFLSLCR